MISQSLDRTVNSSTILLLDSSLRRLSNYTKVIVIIVDHVSDCQLSSLPLSLLSRLVAFSPSRLLAGCMSRQATDVQDRKYKEVWLAYLDSDR
jgi:hypothetical protein